MCTGLELLFGALSVAGTALGALGSKTPDPPAVEVPAVAAAESNTPNAIVRVGADSTTKDATAAPDFTPLVEKRASGKSLGNLGRSGLAL